MKKPKLLSDVIIYSISSFLSKGISFLLLPLYTRIFSTYEYGILDILSVSIVLLTLLVSCQIEQGVARFFIDSKSHEMKQAIATTGFFHTLIIFTITIHSILVIKKP